MNITRNDAAPRPEHTDAGTPVLDAKGVHKGTVDLTVFPARRAD